MCTNDLFCLLLFQANAGDDHPICAGSHSGSPWLPRDIAVHPVHTIPHRGQGVDWSRQRSLRRYRYGTNIQAVGTGIKCECKPWIRILSRKKNTFRTRTDELVSVTRCVCFSARVHVCAAFDWVEKYAPGFKKSVVGRDILTPPDLERIFGLTGGVRFQCQHLVRLTRHCSPDEEVVCVLCGVPLFTQIYAAPLHKLLSVIDCFLPQTKGHSPSFHSLRQVAPQMFLYFCFMTQSLKRCRTAFSTYLRSLARKWETEYSYPLSYNRIYSMGRCHSTNCTWPDLCPLSQTTAHPLKDCICAAVAVTQVGSYLWIIKLCTEQCFEAEPTLGPNFGDSLAFHISFLFPLSVSLS